MEWDINLICNALRAECGINWTAWGVISAAVLAFAAIRISNSSLRMEQDRNNAAEKATQSRRRAVAIAAAHACHDAYLCVANAAIVCGEEPGEAGNPMFGIMMLRMMDFIPIAAMDGAESLDEAEAEAITEAASAIRSLSGTVKLAPLVLAPGHLLGTLQSSMRKRLPTLRKAFVVATIAANRRVDEIDEKIGSARTLWQKTRELGPLITPIVQDGQLGTTQHFVDPDSAQESNS